MWNERDPIYFSPVEIDNVAKKVEDLFETMVQENNHLTRTRVLPKLFPVREWGASGIGKPSGQSDKD